MTDSRLLSPPLSSEGVKSPSLPPSSLSSAPGSPRVSPSRTVAIIKPHALDFRFEIEHRIAEANFEIVKERQMEFDVETDPDTLFELFGADANAFADGPVWVYVLERRRAIEVWNTIMGDPDPSVARVTSPNSLRALYGLSKEQNAVMGSPDAELAEIQIASLFVSSPPFPATDLPEDGKGSIRSISSAVLSALRRQSSEAHASTGDTSVSSGFTADRSLTTSVSSSKLTASHAGTNGKAGFKARALPATHVTPSIAPRSSRAADLRAGIIPAKQTENGPRRSLDKTRVEEIFANTPGHKRASSIMVASTAAPSIAPRMTKAAALRLGIQPASTSSRQRPRTSAGPQTQAEKEKAKAKAKATFEGVPGHKRRESIAVASTRVPTVAPRLNKSAALRVQKDAAPPTSYQFRGPVSTPRSTPSSRPPSVVAHSRSLSRSALTRSTSNGTSNGHSDGLASAARPPSTTPQPQRSGPRPSSLALPTVAPRQNKSALLRAAKMAGDAATPKARPRVFL